MKSFLYFMLFCWTLSFRTVYGQFTVSNVAPIFIVPPSSTMGTITGNTLTLTPLPNGFIVGGQLTVLIPPGPSSGVLAQWTIERRLDPTFSASGIQTNTILTGFSLPPAGTFSTTTGSVVTDYRFTSGGTGFVGGSQSLVPMTLVNGVDSPAWNSLTGTSVPFTWTAGFFPNGIMQQQFTLFGNYTGGAGGNWVIDVPVTSITTVPEPSSWAMMFGLASIGMVILIRRRRQLQLMIT